MSKKFNKLTLSPHWQQYFSKYPDGYTIIENLIDWISQVNKMVDSYNELTTHVDNFKESVGNTTDGFREELDTFLEQFDDNLAQNVITTLSDWQTSGFLDVVIDEALNTKYHEMDERLTTQLAHIESDVNVKSASICLIDDDSKIEFLTELKPILDSYGWKASIAVPSSTIGNPTNMDITQLRGLISEGFEVVSHGYDNTRFGDVSKSVVRTQLQSATDTFKELGIESDVLVYAQGSSSQEASEVVKDFFKVALDSSGVRNTEPTDTYNLKRVPIGPWGINDIDVLKTIVWNAHQNKELLVLETHKYAHTPEQDILLNELFSYIDNLGHKVTTFSEAYQKHNNKIEYGHYNYDMGMSGLMIGKDGTLNGLALPNSTLRDGSVDSDSKPKDFLFHADRKYENFSQEFTSKISGVENNLPDEAKLSNGTYTGSLTTNIKVIDGNMFHVFQTFRRNSDNRYWTRQASSREEWGAWRTFSPDEIIREKPPINAKPSYYNYKKGLEINTYSNAEVEETTLPGGGTLITTCVGASNTAFVKQDYRGYQTNEYYIRSGKSDDTWTSWVNIRE